MKKEVQGDDHPPSTPPIPQESRGLSPAFILSINRRSLDLHLLSLRRADDQLNIFGKKINVGIADAGLPIAGFLQLDGKEVRVNAFQNAFPFYRLLSPLMRLKANLFPYMGLEIALDLG
jgi:hypothetical protein